MYYSIIDKEILFEEINYHPLFSYALNIVKNKYDKYTVYVSNEFDIEIVKEYYYDVLYFKENQIFEGQNIELNRPLLNINHLKGQFDKLYNFQIKDTFDLVAAKSLISSDFCSSRPEKIYKKFTIHKIINPMKPRLLFTAPYDFFKEELTKYINKNYEVTYAYQAPENIIKSLIIDQDILFTSTCPTYLIDENLLNNSNIHTIASPSTGTNHIDMTYIRQKQIKVISIKKSPVIEKIYASSEFSFTLLLSMINKLPEIVNNAKLSGWRENESKFRSNELYGKKIGLLGYGRIGKKMAKYSRAFGMEVNVFDPYIDIKEKWINVHSSKSRLLKHCDIISLHYHLNESTKNSFTSKDFSIMKKNSFFLNTSRAEIVDENAMLESLKKNKLKAAAVDVISNEHIYNKWDHPVIKFARENNNLIVSSHVAGLTVESESKAATDILTQLKIHLNGK